jgi:hypothetical protein
MANVETRMNALLPIGATAAHATISLALTFAASVRMVGKDLVVMLTLTSARQAQVHVTTAECVKILTAVTSVIVLLGGPACDVRTTRTNVRKTILVVSKRATPDPPHARMSTRLVLVYTHAHAPPYSLAIIVTKV